MRKNYTSKYKAESVLEVLSEAETLNKVAGRRGVHPNLLGRWRNEAVEKLHTLYEDHSEKEKRFHETQTQELYAQIGELTAKLSWLKKKSGIEI
jgi:putative transposase